MSWKVWVVIACAALAAVLGSGIAFAFTETSQVRQLDAQVAQLHRDHQEDTAKLTEMGASIGSIDARVAGLSNPVDPLSAYTDTCNAQLTNNATDVMQTYYYPCTNSAQTIPQPGS